MRVALVQLATKVGNLAGNARAEYKCRQALPGIKVTGKALGVGRPVPIANPFRSG